MPVRSQPEFIRVSIKSEGLEAEQKGTLRYLRAFAHELRSASPSVAGGDVNRPACWAWCVQLG